MRIDIEWCSADIPCREARRDDLVRHFSNARHAVDALGGETHTGQFWATPNKNGAKVVSPPVPQLTYRFHEANGAVPSTKGSRKYHDDVGRISLERDHSVGVGSESRSVSPPL